MTYRCEKCGHIETIWNSRDGVTPFIVNCTHKGCEGMKQHISFRSDKFDMCYIPPKGSRMFVDNTKALYRKQLRVALKKRL